MSFQIDLSGTVALVTGASRGLGHASALALAQAGADLALSARNIPDLERTAESARAHGVRVETFPVELTDALAIRRMVERVLETFGRIDALVNNAGISGPEKRFLDLEPEDWDAVLNVNLRGAGICAQAVARAMVAQKGGRIVNVASMGAIRPLTRLSAYCASKAGLVQLTRVMAVELARHNVRVNAVCPGYFLTPMNERFFATAQGQEVIQRDIPVRRLGDPAELGPTIVYLASEASSFMTGAVISIDGGHTLN